MGKIKDALYRLFRGRYGADSLNSFLLWAYFVFMILWLFTGIDIFGPFALICMVISVFRMFSKNYYKRQQENTRFINLKYRAKQKVNLCKDKWRFRKTHIYRKCPNCKAVLKLPRKKGQHECCCPRCKKNFRVYCP